IPARRRYRCRKAARLAGRVATHPVGLQEPDPSQGPTRTPDMMIQTTAKLLMPANCAGKQRWTFLVLPKAASDKLSSRGMVGIDGTINGTAFTAVLEPDGQKGHWLKVGEALRKKAGVAVGDTV